MVKIEEARAAKAILKERLGKVVWLRGIGIGDDVTAGFALRVNVREDSEEVRKAVPTFVNSVRVEIYVVGEAEALIGPRPG